jgi:dipeptidyl aminopeptidase/acylaminoacyl peptidase
VAGVMVSDLVSHALSNSEMMMPMPNYMRAENQQHMMSMSMFDGWNSYLEDSPIYHMKSINAPILLWNGSNDKNVSPAQSKMFFLGMKRLQKKAVLLEYLNDSHNIVLPENQLDLDIKTWQWFDHYLKNKSPADWIAPIIK